MKELSIGGEIRIRCVEGGNCFKCSLFRRYGPCGIGKEKMPCTIRQRTDHKDVHFELVENPDTPDPIELPTDEEISAYSSMHYTGSAVHYVREGMRIMKKMIEEKLKDKDNESN